jgi:hypothetical protein
MKLKCGLEQQIIKFTGEPERLHFYGEKENSDWGASCDLYEGRIVKYEDSVV